MVSEEKLDQIISDLQLIKNHLKIVPDREIIIHDSKQSIQEYEKFARDDLKIDDSTIRNQKSILSNFLKFCNGEINKESIKSYLESNGSDSWKSNQLKALRRYTRDFLQLGNWIEQFQFTQTSSIKRKSIPSDEQLVEFYHFLSHISQIAFLILHDSGLRIGEVSKLRVKDIDFETRMIDASEIHEGDTKHSYLSFITEQTSEILFDYIDKYNKLDDYEMSLFDVSARTIQKDFQSASLNTGIEINPHMLRTVFTEKCTTAKLPDKYIDAFCGRTPKRIIAKHYSDYSPEAMRKRYDMIEPYLVLDLQ